MKIYLKTLKLMSVTFAMAVGGFILISQAVAAAEPPDLKNLDGIGILDDIRSYGVVINDTFHQLAPGVEYKSAFTKKFTRVSFQRGDKVGFVKNDKGRIIVLWRLPN